MNGINPILLIYAVGLHSVVGMIHKAINCSSQQCCHFTVSQYKLNLQRSKVAGLVCLRTVTTILISSSSKANANEYRELCINC